MLLCYLLFRFPVNFEGQIIPVYHTFPCGRVTSHQKVSLLVNQEVKALAVKNEIKLEHNFLKAQEVTSFKMEGKS